LGHAAFCHTTDLAPLSSVATVQSAASQPWHIQFRRIWPDARRVLTCQYKAAPGSPGLNLRYTGHQKCGKSSASSHSRPSRAGSRPRRVRYAA
jgi:hypothetical protein